MDLTALRESEILVDGVRSPLLIGGPEGASEAVVFVHGNPGSSRDWMDLASRVSEFARVLAFDMPGFGRADKPENFDYTVPGYARHLARAVEQVGVQRAHLVLHDFGGPWGLEWAVAHPNQFATATLINTGALFGYRWHYLARIWRTPRLGEAFMATTTRPAFRLLARQGNPRGLPREYVDRAFDEFDRKTRRAVLKLYRATSDPSGVGRRQAEALRPLDRPALVVRGQHDPYIPVRYAEVQREAFPSAKVVVLERSGHWPFVDDPEGVAAATVPFLREQVTEPTASP